MPRPVTSLADLEAEVDITKSISCFDKCVADITASSFDQNLGIRSKSGVNHLLSESDGEGDEAFIEAQRVNLNRKISNIKGKSVKKGGGFQVMGLDSHLLKSISRKGFSIPTPIQRKAIPPILDHQDVVGMARTGSGKTAAFVIPLIQRLKAHSGQVGARALIMSPSRELAFQTIKVVKELGRGTNLKCVLLVGGDSLEDQFGLMTTNPDIIIATPGRFLHLKIEMSLDLSSIKYVVFDEADRLFEMGFSAQLTEILHALPTSRQTLLFSATLPKSLVEFARAGLQEPKLVRLDTESKVPPDLESAFFSVKSAEKEGALLFILNSLIKIPTHSQQDASNSTDDSKKRKRNGDHFPQEKLSESSTIIFAATKHHVEYLAAILRISGYAVSYAYGSLDQVARNIQVENFRKGITNILVVTDVAARGIDIPILANVINYHFPPQPKVFVHRVGRTARAGKRGWSYTLVRDTDAPYLLDLQLFLGRKLVFGADTDLTPNYADSITLGALPRDRLENSTEWINKIFGENDDIVTLRSVAERGEKLYIKTRNSASSESVQRAKEIVSSKSWIKIHALFQGESSNTEQARIEMLARVSEFRPQETIFEIGTKGKSSYNEVADMMKLRREKLVPRRSKAQDVSHARLNHSDNKLDDETFPSSKVSGEVSGMDEASDIELEVTFSTLNQKGKDCSLPWKDSENYIHYTPKNINTTEERGYGVHSGSYNTTSQNSNFVQAARSLALDLTNDDGGKSFAHPAKAKGMRWDKKNSKYVIRANDEDGSKGSKMIRGESGQKISASFQSGRFDKWCKAYKLDRLPRTGEIEKPISMNVEVGRGIRSRFKHKQLKAPKEADRYRDDYNVRKKRVAEAKEKRIGKWKDGSGKKEVKSIDEIRKIRKLTERKKAKNARSSKKVK